MKRFLVIFVVGFALVQPAVASAVPQQLTYRYGPIEVGPYEVDQQTILNGVPKPSVNGYITGMEADVVDAQGRSISPVHVMLHHVVFLNLGEPGKFDHKDWTCSTFAGLDGTKVPALADRFYASGEERNKLELPGGYGYPVSGKDSWVLLWMLMNHHPQSQKVFIQYKVTYESEQQLTPAYMVWLDVRNCLSDPVFDVPGGGAPGSTFSQSATWAAPTAGRIVAGGGHLHGGGTSTDVTQPDCGDRLLFSSRPLFGLPNDPIYQAKPILHEPGPLNMSGFLSPQGIPLAQGQHLKLTANYDNRYPHMRVMGIFGLYFAPDPGVPSGCGPIPPLDVRAAAGPGRGFPPRFKVPLARKPRGKLRKLRSGSTIRVRDFSFSPERVEVRTGSTLRWKFEDVVLHDLTVANGPRGFSSPNSSNGDVFRVKLTKPGRYQLFCTLHPTAMTAEVRVSGKPGSRLR